MFEQRWSRAWRGNSGIFYVDDSVLAAHGITDLEKNTP